MTAGASAASDGRIEDDGRADAVLRRVDELLARADDGSGTGFDDRGAADDLRPFRALLVAGVPAGGKTEFALAATLKGIGRFGDEAVAMAVGNRQTADALGDRAIRAVGAVSVARPVTTLAAIAFRLLTDWRRSQGAPLPKLINGAEQDALLRRVVEVHVRHARAGELCGTCELMRRYFAAQDWVESIYSDPADDTLAAQARPETVVRLGRGANGASASGAAAPEGNARQTSRGIGSSDVLFERGVNDAFVMQLRDMIARMDELGLSDDREGEVLEALGPAEGRDDLGQRLAVQWRLAFTLRREYVQTVQEVYPEQFRIDSSKLLVEGAAAVRRLSADVLPRMVVVDDFQDLTLAGLAFLEELAGRGVLLVLVGNPDEAVQTFRGSYPEYLFDRARLGPIGAEPVSIGEDVARSDRHADSEPSVSTKADALHAVDGSDGFDASEGREAPIYRDLVASRVSLSITSDEPTDVALPSRPGKLEWFKGALPIKPLPHGNVLPADGTVSSALYRSSREQLDDVVWRIKQEHLAKGRQWNDMALIAHDNDTVRAFGERLRRDGVPVRYSAVTAPLKDDPSVQGLFALIELAQLRREGIQGTSMDVAGAARFVRSRVRTLLESPLMEGADGASGRGDAERRGARRSLRSMSVVGPSAAPASLASVESVMRAVDELDKVCRQDNAGAVGPSPGSARNDVSVPCEANGLKALRRRWDGLRQQFARREGSGGVVVDDSLLDGPMGEQDAAQASAGSEAGADVAFGVDAMYVMLAFGDSASDGAPGTTNESDGPVNGIAVPAEGRAADGSDVVNGPDSRGAKSAEDGRKDVRPDLPDDDGDSCDVVADGVVAEVLSLLTDVGGGRDRHIRAFVRLWDVVDRVASGMGSLQVPEPQYVLGLAWDCCGVALDWQRQALVADADGRAANDRLDVMMRLFSYAAGSGARQSMEDFISSVRSMRVAADSLAKVAPIDQAVTLTTPAGAAGRHWPLVWIVQVTEGTWPNLAARNTMFGGEDLADVVLHRGLHVETGSEPGAELMRVLGAEQRGFLVALTRAESKVFVGSVLSDADVPSDFLYVYLPELFDRDRDADPPAREYAKVAGASRFAGLDADPRGLLTAARVELARQSAEGLNDGGFDAQDDGAAGPRPGNDVLREARVDDAVETLSALAGAGLEAADPRNWSFVDWNEPGEDNNMSANGSKGGRQKASGDASRVVADGVSDVASIDGTGGASEGLVVRLSPSQVDAIWGCPVCWMLENQFAGPRPSSAATNFGSLIHQVADEACKAGLDDPEYLADLPESERVAQITDRMMGIYRGIAGDYSMIADPAERYRAERKDDGARQALQNIATYFVVSNASSYLNGNIGYFEVGRLVRAESEQPFAGLFGLDDILTAYNAIDGVNPIGRRELAAIMGSLVGGWPDGMQEDMRVRLTGRIDRVEWRDPGDGTRYMRVIDWKTGRSRHTARQMFNDLQLVCYQLGFAFPQPQTQSDSQDRIGRAVVAASDVSDASTFRRASGPVPDMPDIRQSELFDVELDDAPAKARRSPETNFQPPLFRGGALNAEPFTPRYYVKKPDGLFDLPDLPAGPPQGVGDRAWADFTGLRGTQAVWALTMISRVFYAAAASRSNVLTAHPQSDHVVWCQKHHASYVVCPACAGQVDTVFETRRAGN